MSKQIKVSDEVFAQLKEQADSSFRSLGGQIEFLMSHQPKQMHIIDDFDEMKASLVETRAKVRSKGDILADIADVDREIKTTVNQDPDYWAMLDQKKKALWEEYRAE